MLARCLEALGRQTLPASAYEVVVVDDGSTDGTEELLVGMARQAPFPMLVLRQANRGPAAARNAGLRAAVGELVLFIGDDIIPSPSLLEEHARRHALAPGDNGAVLGHVAPHPELRTTPFTEWLHTASNLQFAYAEITDPTRVSFRYFYTANISLHRRFLLEGGEVFHEGFRGAAWEDIELGYRLVRRGLSIVYYPAALAYHLHPMSFASVCARMRMVGRAAAVLQEVTPALYDELYGKGSWRRRLPLPEAALGLATRLVSWMDGLPLRWRLGWLYYPLLRSHHWAGYHAAPAQRRRMKI